MTQEQLGFGFDEMLHEQETAHLPGKMEEGIPYFRKLIDRHHEATMAGDMAEVVKIREEADELAAKLNGGTRFGVMGGPDAPCYVLERATQAPVGTVPLYGQTGAFTIDVNGMRMRIEQDGMFGIGMMANSPAPGFAAHAVDFDKPFISETGYRSFIGYRPELPPGTTPEELARQVIKTHIQRELKGKLKKIERSYVEREMARREVAENPRNEQQL